MYLSLKREVAEMKFVAKALLVGRLEEARPKLAMHLDRRPDNLFGELFVKKFAPCLRVSVVVHVWRTPTLNSGTSGFSAAASRACVMASRVSIGSMILSIHNLAAP